jgi:hypothetical protein
MYNSYVILAKLFRRLSSIFYSQYIRFQLGRSIHVSNGKGTDLSTLLSKSSFIHGMISFDEAKVLFYLGSLGGAKGDVLEIGSWLGRSTTFLATGCKTSSNGIVHAVDTFKGNPGKEHMYNSPLKESESIYGRFKNNITKMGLKNYVKVYRMNSKTASKYINKKFRLIFIDGCHEYGSVTEDIKLWKGRLKSGGYLALHDYVDMFPGSMEAIKENLINSENFLLLFLTDTLIVFQKKGD